MDIEKLVKVSVGSDKWFGIVEKSDSGATITNAVGAACSIRELVNEWITRENLGELSTISVSATASYSIKPLTKKEKIVLRRRWEDMKNVKEIAIAKLQNGYFVEDDE